MHEHDTTLHAIDGRQLAATLYEPETWRASLALLGAFGVRRRYYRRFATYLAEHGYRVLTFDCRGIGDSLQGRIQDETVTATDWARLDHGAAIDWLDAQPGPNLAVGHSFGGQVPGITDKAKAIDAMYAVAAQLGYHGHWDGVTRYRMQLIFHGVMPAITHLFGYCPGWAGIGEHIPKAVMLEWARWLRSPNYLIDHVPGAAERFEAWPGQIVIPGFTDDDYAPPRGVQALAAAYQPDHCTALIRSPEQLDLAEVGHFGFFRELGRERLWPECLAHLEQWQGLQRGLQHKAGGDDEPDRGGESARG